MGKYEWKTSRLKISKSYIEALWAGGGTLSGIRKALIRRKPKLISQKSEIGVLLNKKLSEPDERRNSVKSAVSQPEDNQSRGKHTLGKHLWLV